MGKKRKNKTEDSSIGFKPGTEFEVNQVKMPFWVNVTYQDNISKDNNGKPIYGTGTILVKKDISEKEDIIKEFEKEGYKEIIVNELTVPFADLCPKCDRKGIPKVERKSNKFDYHARKIAPLTEEPKHKNPTNRPDELWLCYDHKEKPVKCRVTKFDKNHLTFTNKGRVNHEIQKYILPYYVEWKKKELVSE